MRYIVVISIILMSVGCRTFDDTRLRNDVLSYHQHTDSVVAGMAIDTSSAIKFKDHLRPTSVDSIAKLIDVGPVILAYRDSTLRRRTLKGVIDEYHGQDSIIDVRSIPDEDLPYTLSVALRNVDGIYAQKEHPDYTRIDPGLSFLWTLTLPAFALLGAVVGLFLGGIMNIGPNDNGIFIRIPDSGAYGFVIGSIGGIASWLALTF